MDEDITYLSLSSAYGMLKKYDVVISWKKGFWASKKADKPQRLDEIWQTDIMYVKVTGIFYYLLIFIDVYSRYIVHHKLLISMDDNSIAAEAQVAIEKLRKGSLAEPDIQSDNGSGFISMEFKTVLKANNLTHKRIKPHTPTDNAFIERANRTVREELETTIVLDFQDAVVSIDRIVHWYNNERRHSSLNYLPPTEYYRGDPDVRIAVREAKMEMAKRIRKENNIER
ncbi:MAG: transposase [Cuniculiplasma sp.]